MNEDNLYVDENGESIPNEGPPPTEPVRKSVAGLSVGSGALVILWLVQQFGLQMEPEIALAIAGLVGAAAAYLKSEDVF